MAVTKTGNDHEPRQTSAKDHNPPASDQKLPVNDHK